MRIQIDLLPCGCSLLSWLWNLRDQSDLLTLSVCFKLQALGAKSCAHVVASPACDVVKKRSPKIASRHAVTRHGRKEVANFNQR